MILIDRVDSHLMYSSCILWVICILLLTVSSLLCHFTQLASFIMFTVTTSAFQILSLSIYFREFTIFRPRITPWMSMASYLSCTTIKTQYYIRYPNLQCVHLYKHSSRQPCPNKRTLSVGFCFTTKTSPQLSTGNVSQYWLKCIHDDRR